MKRLQLNENVFTAFNKNRVRFAQLCSGESMLISKECYNILEKAISSNMTADELLACISDADDRAYFHRLIQLLYNKHILKGENDSSRLGSINIELTHRCNLNCRHCSASAFTMNAPEYLSTEEMLVILKNLADLNPENICITGGEPLVRRDFYQLMDYLKENYSGVLSIMTNATLVTAQNVDKLAEYFKVWDISLDGVNEKTCSKIRGKGVYTRVMESIRLLRNAGIEHISLSMVVTAATQDYVHDFMKLNGELGTYAIIREFEVQGRGEENALELMPDDVSSDYSEMERIADEIGNESTTPSCFTCGAARSEFFITYTGDVYPCAPMDNPRFKICSANRNDLAEYIKSGEYRQSSGYKALESYFPQNFEKCKACCNNVFCWSCARDVYTKSLDSEKFERRCNLKLRELRGIWR